MTEPPIRIGPCMQTFPCQHKVWVYGKRMGTWFFPDIKHFCEANGLDLPEH